MRVLNLVHFICHRTLVMEEKSVTEIYKSSIVMIF